MRRHFSLQRLALVVAWAALAPKCALLVQSWTGLLPQATVSDAVRVAAEFQGKWNRWSDRAGTVAEKLTAPFTGPKNFAGQQQVPQTMDKAASLSPPSVPATHEPSPAEAEVVRAGFPSAKDVAARRFSRTLPSESRRVPNLPSVVIR